MNGVAEYLKSVEVDGERYDVWRSREDDTVYVSEFCQDELKEVSPEQASVLGVDV